MPQSSLLGPLRFLVYINDITTSVRHFNTRLFTDDTCLIIVVNNREKSVHIVQSALGNINKWAKNGKSSLPLKTNQNPLQSENKKNLKRDAHLNPRIHFKYHIIEKVHSHTYLGLLFTSSLSWNPLIANVELKARKKHVIFTTV